MNAQSQIPIIGAPRVEEWWFNLVLKCPCGETVVMIGRPGAAVAACRKCDYVFKLMGVPQVIPGTMEANIPIATGRRSRANDEPTV